MTSETEYAERRDRLLGPMTSLDDEGLKRKVGDSYRRIVQALDSLSPGQATWKPHDQEWSAAEVADHIVLSTGALGKIAGMLAQGKEPAETDWDPPPQFKGDASDLDGVRTRLAGLTTYTDQLFDESAAANRLDITANNSFLGDLNWREWYYFLHVHVQSHVEQIEKLNQTDGFPA